MSENERLVSDAVSTPSDEELAEFADYIAKLAASGGGIIEYGWQAFSKTDVPSDIPDQ
jgi:hypothetical protein